MVTVRVLVMNYLDTVKEYRCFITYLYIYIIYSLHFKFHVGRRSN